MLSTKKIKIEGIGGSRGCVQHCRSPVVVGAEVENQRENLVQKMVVFWKVHSWLLFVHSQSRKTRLAHFSFINQTNEKHLGMPARHASFVFFGFR